jgi:hypothetical protein
MRSGRRILYGAALASAALIAVPVAGAVAAGSNAAASSGLTPVHVQPSVGGPRSAFTVSLRVPQQTGTSAGVRRTDTLTATGPSRPGCVSSAEQPLRAATAGSTVRVRLVPGGRSAHWCAGTFHGSIVESQTVRCGPPLAQILCPQIMIRPQTIGRFRFDVRRG